MNRLAEWWQSSHQTRGLQIPDPSCYKYLLFLLLVTPIFVVTAKTRTSIIHNTLSRCKLHQMQVMPEECSGDNVLPDRALHTYQSLIDEMKIWWKKAVIYLEIELARHNLYIHCNGSKFVSDDCLSCDGPLSSSSCQVLSHVVSWFCVIVSLIGPNSFSKAGNT